MLLTIDFAKVIKQYKKPKTGCPTLTLAVSYLFNLSSQLSCWPLGLSTGGDRILEGDEADELDVELNGEVTSEYLLPILQELVVFSSIMPELFAAIAEGWFANTTNASWLLAWSTFWRFER